MRRAHRRRRRRARRSPRRADGASSGSIPGATPRDLFWGVGGQTLRAAAPTRVYTFEAKDDTGFSVSYDVTSPDGIEWSAKIGPEAQTEVVVSRILWGLGYHQPPVYYLPSWTLDDRGRATPDRERGALPPEAAAARTARDVWSWADNPFIGTRELRGCSSSC